MADGRVLIDTEIQTKTLDRQIIQAQNKISKLSRSSANLTEELRNMEKMKMPTKEFADAQKQIDETRAKLWKLDEQMDKFIETGGKTDSRVFKGMQYDAEQLRNTLKVVKEEMDDMKSSGDAYLTVPEIKNDTEYLEKAEKLSEINALLSEQAAKYSALKEKKESVLQSTEQNVKEEKKVGNEAKKSSKKTSDWLDSFRNKAKSTGEKVHGLASKVKGAAGAFTKFAFGAKKGSGILSNFASRFKGIALSLLVFNWITKAWNEMISAIKDGTQNVAKYSADVNAKMSALTSAIATLKNAFASLAAPIISVAGPAITSFINMLTSAINKVNQFISAITGKKTWLKATTQVKDYAGGLDDAAAGAYDAAKAAKKLKGQLQSFNELNVINSNDSGSGSGGSGGSGGGGTASDMFEEVAIDSDIKNLADEIRKNIESGNWEGVGECIRDELIGAMESIDWDSIYQKASNFGKDLAEFLNGLFKEDKKGNTVFGELGTTIANSINTALNFSDGFADEFDFESLGNAVRQGVMNALDGIDWDLAKETFSNFGTGLATTLNSFFKTDKDGNSVFTSTGEAIAEALNTAMNFLGSFGETFEWEDFGEGLARGVKRFFKKWDAGLSGKTFSTFVNGILDSIVSFIDTLNEDDTWKTIIQKFVDFLSAVDFKEIAVNLSEIAEGLLTALKEAIDELSDSDTFTTIGQKIADFICGIEWGELAWDFAGLWDAIKDAILDIPKDFAEGFVGGIIENLFGEEAGKKVKDAIDNFADSKLGKALSKFNLKTLIGAIPALKAIDDFISNFKKIKSITDLFGLFGNDDEENEEPKTEEELKQKRLNEDKYKMPISVSLVKDGWTDIDDFVGEIKKKAFKLGKDGWTTISKFVGEVGDKAFKLAKKGWTTISKFVGDIGNKAFKLGKSGWTTVSKFVGDIGNKSFKLAKDGWTTLNKFVGKLDKVAVKLFKSGWTSISSFVGTSVKVGIRLIKDGWNDFKKWLGIGDGGSATKKADGGAFYNGSWHSIAQYAAGGFPSHGSMFIAGEAGSELVGHIGGRTEVLNQSQIASIMYSSVLSAMETALSKQKDSSQQQPLQVFLDGQVIFDNTRKRANEYFGVYGKSAFEY